MQPKQNNNHVNSVSGNSVKFGLYIQHIVTLNEIK